MRLNGDQPGRRDVNFAESGQQTLAGIVGGIARGIARGA